MAIIYDFTSGNKIGEFTEFTENDLAARRRGYELLKLMEEQDAAAHEVVTPTHPDTAS